MDSDDLKAKVLKEGDCFGILYERGNPDCSICTVRARCMAEMEVQGDHGGKRTMAKKNKDHALITDLKAAIEECEDLDAAFAAYEENYDTDEEPEGAVVGEFFLKTAREALAEDEEAAADVIKDILGFLGGEEEEPEAEEKGDDDEPEEKPAKGKGKKAEAAPEPKAEKKAERTYTRKSNTPVPKTFGERPDRSAQKTIEDELTKGTAHDKIIALVAKEFYDGDMKPATRRFKNSVRKMKEQGTLPVVKAAKAEKKGKGK